ncbi:MAG: BtpA/SgcQ family protein [Vampirovibrionales bacterium]
MPISSSLATQTPIMGVLSVATLPGAYNPQLWQGPLESIIAQAEQEALALTTGGVNVIWIRFPTLTAINPASLASAGAIITAIKRLCSLPLGIDWGPHSTEALALAWAHQCSFTHLPVATGSVLTASGWISNQSAPLQQAFAQWHIPNQSLIVSTSVTPHHQLPLSNAPKNCFSEMVLATAHHISQWPQPTALCLPQSALAEEDWPALLAALELKAPRVLRWLVASNDPLACSRLAAYCNGIILDDVLRNPTQENPDSSKGSLSVPQIEHWSRGLKSAIAGNTDARCLPAPTCANEPESLFAV